MQCKKGLLLTQSGHLVCDKWPAIVDSARDNGFPEVVRTFVSTEDCTKRSFVTGTNHSTEEMMRPTDPTSEHFIHAEKLRQLRRQLTGTTDHLQRDEILRQIDEIEEEFKNQFKP